MKNKYLQSGLTLVEIMVALLIGLFLLAGILQTFVGSKQTNRLLEELARIQENGRYAIDLLATDIRMAGFIGCNRPTTINNVINAPVAPGNFLYNFAMSVEGFEATSASTWTPAINSAIINQSSDLVGGSDVVTIRHADNMYGFPVTSHSTSSADLILDGTATTANLKSADILKSDGTNNCAIVVVNNCSNASIFEVTSIAGSVLGRAGGCVGGVGVGNSTVDLGSTFGSNGVVYPVNTISYYIKTSNNQPTLYRKIGSKNAEPLVEGIEQMQIQYGVDKGAGDCDQTSPTTTLCDTADFYVTADQLAGLAATDKIISVRISLLAVSLDTVTSGPTEVIYNGNKDQHTDGLLRRVFTSTISIRN